jgi:hypothetical protein
MGIFYLRTPDAQPWMSRTAETQRDPRVISLIPAGERPAHSSSTKAWENETKALPPGWFAEAFSLTHTFHLLN